ncbi:MAG: hypothetical protein WBZ36_29335 [Candidatus Nitrosopolaris sp.]
MTLLIGQTSWRTQIILLLVVTPGLGGSASKPCTPRQATTILKDDIFLMSFLLTLKGVFFVCLSLYSEYDGKVTVVVTAVTTTTYL